MVGSRGFEPRSARSERAASANCATSRRCGDHGRIRTTTGQALDLLPLPDWATWPLVPLGGLEPPPRGLRARHAPLTLQRGLELIPGIEPGHRPYQGRRLPLHQISVERMAGFEPAPQGLEGPQATVTPHSLWFGLGSCPGRTRTGVVHRPIDIVGCQRPRSFRAHPLARTVWRQRSGFEPGPTSVGGSDASVTPRCRRHLMSPQLRRQTLPATWPAFFSRA